MDSQIRKTVREVVRFKGLGLHSGLQVTATVRPSERGIEFVAGGRATLAVPENVTDTTRCTRLGDVSTIEHLMAAFAALGVSDASVEVEGGELPAMDGAAREYCNAVVETGTVEVGVREIDGPYARVYHVEGGAKIAVSKGEGVWRYEYELGERWPGSQHFESRLDANVFLQEIAPARTFALEEEMDLVRQGLVGKGLNESNGFVIGATGYLNPVKFDDEPARHKMLDLIGDLWLAGVPIEFLNVVSHKGGHKANVAMAKKLRDSVKIVN